MPPFSKLFLTSPEAKIAYKQINGQYYLPESVKILPDHLIIPGDLILPKDGLQILPSYLTVEGNLNLNGTAIHTINSNLTVTGALVLTGSKIKHLPDHIYVRKLIVKNSDLITIGSHLTVNSNFELWHSNITSIGSYLTVQGVLDINNSKLQMLPEHATIFKLVIGNCDLEALPSFLTVKSDLVLTGTKIKKLGKATTVEANLDLAGTDIRELPNDLWVSTDDETYRIFGHRVYLNGVQRCALILKNTKIVKLPCDMYAECLILDTCHNYEFENWVEVDDLFMATPVRGEPINMDVSVIYVDGRNQEAVDCAIHLNPAHKLVIAGGSPHLPANKFFPFEIISVNCSLEDLYPEGVNAS